MADTVDLTTNPGYQNTVLRLMRLSPGQRQIYTRLRGNVDAAAAAEAMKRRISDMKLWQENVGTGVAPSAREIFEFKKGVKAKEQDFGQQELNLKSQEQDQNAAFRAGHLANEEAQTETMTRKLQMEEPTSRTHILGGLNIGLGAASGAVNWAIQNEEAKSVRALRKRFEDQATTIGDQNRMLRDLVTRNGLASRGTYDYNKDPQIF